MPYVKDKVQIDRVLEEAAANNAVICYTIVSPELREHMADRALAKDVEVVDVLGPMLKSIEKNHRHAAAQPSWPDSLPGPRLL